VDVVSSGLLNTSSCSVVGIFVDSALKLLQELVDVQEIALGPQVRQGQRVGVMHWGMRSLGDHCATVAVLGHARGLVATENGELDTLETHQTLANVVVGGGVNSTALGIAKELVQSVVCCTFTDLVVVGQLLCLVDSIVDWAIGGVLRWASVESGRSTSRMLLAISSVGSKGTIRILVSTRCSGKRLQVSYDCNTG
jgi:hypothetical protein